MSPVLVLLPQLHADADASVVVKRVPFDFHTDETFYQRFDDKGMWNKQNTCLFLHTILTEQGHGLHYGAQSAELCRRGTGTEMQGNCSWLTTRLALS